MREESRLIIRHKHNNTCLLLPEDPTFLPSLHEVTSISYSPVKLEIPSPHMSLYYVRNITSPALSKTGPQKTGSILIISLPLKNTRVWYVLIPG